jgi:hypothetical protein
MSTSASSKEGPQSPHESIESHAVPPESGIESLEALLQDMEARANAVSGNGKERLDGMSALGVSSEKVSELWQTHGMQERMETNTAAINRLVSSTRERIRPFDTPNGNDNEAVKTPENSIEARREYTRESFQEVRSGMLSGVLTSEVVSNGLNLVPFAGGGKMLFESIAGKELSGAKLTGKERIIHAAMGAGSLALDFTGIGELKDGAILLGKSTGLVEKLGVTLAERGAEGSARIFARTAEFMTANPTLTTQAEKFAEAKIKGRVKDIKGYRRGKRKDREESRQAA